MKPIRSWEMNKKEGTMTFNIDNLLKIMHFMKEMWMTILLPCFGNFIKWVLIRSEPGVAKEGVSADVAAEDGKDRNNEYESFPTPCLVRRDGILWGLMINWKM